MEKFTTLLTTENRRFGLGSTLLFLACLVFSASGFAQTTQTYNATSSFVAPAGVTSVQVEAWGAGGAGGGNTTNSDGGGGGGGGAYSKNTSVSVTGGTTYTVTVGTGGTGGSGNGPAGGDSWFSSTGTVLAKGGGGGFAPVSGNAGAFGTGGASASSVGTTKFSGGNGGAGNNSNSGQGGPGGSSAGTATGGVSGGTSWSTVNAGNAPTGGGKGGNGGTSNNDGAAGTIPGGGGGGSGDGNSIGGSGANGRVIVTWVCPAAYALTSAASATGPFCSASASTVTLRSTSMPTGTYTVTYNLTGATTATGSTATMTFTAGSPGTGTFTTSTLATGNTTITITNLSSGSGCISTISTNNTATVTVSTAPTANAGAGLSAICQGGTSAALGGSVGGSATGGTWSDGGIGGTFSPNANTLNATWTPPSGYSGSAVLTLTTTGGSCGTADQGKTQVVNTLPVITGGGQTQTVCFGTAATVSGMTATTGTILWTKSGGAGTLTGTATLAPVYTPAGADASGTTITLTMTLTNGTCTPATATYTIIVNPAATVDAGATQTICATGSPSVTLAGIVGGGASSGAWTGGAGTFNPNRNTLNAVYTPSAGELAAGGNVVLTLTTNDPTGPCNAVSDTMTITIRLAPTASAGGTQTICAGSAGVVSGATAANGTISWSENGNGSITAGGTGLTPTYTSTGSDAGTTVTLTMTVTNGPCAVATATYTIFVSPLAPTAAGTITGSGSVCVGETLTYSVAAVTNATTYTWTVPVGWTINSGQGSTSINVTAGSAGSGSVSVIASNFCGSTNPSTVVNIFPTNATNNSGFVTNGGTKTSNAIQCNANSGGTERRGFIRFPLTDIPTGATVTAASLSLVHPGTDTSSSATNDIKPLGNTDVLTATGSAIYSAVGGQGSGTNYSSTTWSNTGTVNLTLNSNAVTDIQNRYAVQGYIGMGMVRGGTGVYNFNGYSSGANAPKLAVTYTAPRAIEVTVNALVTPTFNTVAPVCAGASLAALPTTSNNGITGTWSPALNNTATTTYTFTPTAGLCATSTTMQIVVNPNITPTFNAVAAICSGGTLSALPTTSLNGITGTWSPALNNTATTTYTFTSTAGLCATTTTLEIEVIPNATPTFDAVAAICSGGTLSALPTTSLNGITGTWSPALNNTATTTYTFTPTAGLCATTTTLEIEVIPNATPTFDAVAAICSGDSLGALPSISNNGITGTWSPALNNTATTTYTFTPTAGLCATSTTMQIVVNQKITPSFTPVAAICDGAALAALPTVSNNGISGSWSPALDNTNTTTYTFTPDSGECALPTTMQIVVNPILTPTFNAVAPICAGASMSALPTVSINGISGSWSPALNNAATTTYTFTPNVGECAISTTLQIVVNPLITPSFAAVPAICAGDTLDALPTTSLNGVTGSWTPALNNMSTTTYTFNPDSGQCVANIFTTLTITVNIPSTYYADTDGDNFGDAASSINVCSAAPDGYVSNNTDCNVNDGTKWRTGLFYGDADGDGYSNGFPPSTVCYGASRPAGYTAVFIGTDCNDTLATSNPNAVEIPGNGEDDNCDGTIDEVTPTSHLNAQNCGITLTDFANRLYAYQMTSFPEVQPIQGYRFELTNGATVRTFDTNTHSFTLLNFPGASTYGTTYVVRVSIKTGGFWRMYGSPCTITTPARPNSSYITDPISGSTLSTISQTIYCLHVPTASGYRFRVSDGTTVIGTYDSHVNRFNMGNIGISNIDFATTYTVDVLLKFGATWRPDTEYGPTALITTPATPDPSRIINPSCGSTINNLWTSIFALQVPGAQGYKFVVTNGAQTREYATPNSRFSLMNLPGGAVANTTYTIRVDVLRGASYVQGVQTCVISTSPTASRQTNTVLDIYEVKAYPNPFADNFKLDVNTSSEDHVGIRVYDMLGREVEAREASVSTITNLEIGSRYPSGVYNVVVAQGDHVKTLRIIKR